MTLTETIVWHPASEPPSDGRHILLLCGVPEGAGFYSREGIYLVGAYRDCDEWQVAGVTHWADLPRGPAAEGGGE